MRFGVDCKIHLLFPVGTQSEKKYSYGPFLYFKCMNNVIIVKLRIPRISLYIFGMNYYAYPVATCETDPKKNLRNIFDHFLQLQHKMNRM